MDIRVGLFFISILGSSWACGARELTTADLSRSEAVVTDVSVLQIYYQESEREVLPPKNIGSNENLCTQCEEFTATAIKYLSENKTQAEVMDFLHDICSHLRLFKEECLTLVDNYASVFFLEIASMQPEDFCQKVNLCEKIVITSQALSEDSCGLCHRAVAEVLSKLKDPDTQLEIIELLLKTCDYVESYMKKCKTLVFEYGPLILTDVQQFLETTDICTTLHACDLPTASGKQGLSTMKTSMLSAS